MSMNVYTHLIVGQKINRDMMPESALNMMDDGEEITEGEYKLCWFVDDEYHDNPIFGVSLAEADPYSDAPNVVIDDDALAEAKSVVSKHVKKLGFKPDVKLMMIGFWW